MKKISLFVIAFGMMTCSIMAAPPGNPDPTSPRENFDIRNDDAKHERNELEAYRGKASVRAIRSRAAVDQLMAAGRNDLRTRIPNLRIEDNPFGTATEIIDVEGSTTALTEPSAEAHQTQVRRFVQENAALYGLTSEQVNQLKVVADYANPAGNLSWVEFEQRIHEIPVFQGYLRADMGNDGRIWRTTGNLAPGLDYQRLSTAPRLQPTAAAIAAAKTIGISLATSALPTLSVDQQAHLTKLAQGPFTEEIKVELMYFPVEPGLAVLAYSMVLWETHDAYWILVDASEGRLLWRKNITADQTQSVTYSVYNDDSPAPLSPSNVLPGSGTQGAPISRSTITNISELPAFDDLGWIPDGAGNAVTTGNNVDAGLDISSPNGIDTNGRAIAVGRVFDFPYAPAGTPGEEPPTSSNYRMGIVTNIFFWSNRYHDRLYQYGFTEQARNFQNNNFGRGGLGADFVRAEAQDSSGVNNANFATAGDGSPPRMQMYIFTAPTPDRDGDIDGGVFLHELTHGTSNRLHANGSGLATTMSGGMGEGWSDYYARCLLSSADEDVNGIYPACPYVTLNFTNSSTGGTVGTDNYYYGIRRFPYAVKTNVGGPSALRPGQPHNPLTFADIDLVENNILDGAYNANPEVINTPNEAHRIGEVWCMMLLEMRARIVTRLGWATGNDRAIQIVTDGMKLDPASPTILQARDSILAADCAGFGGEDEQDIWAGFATRGAGLSATATGGTTLASDIVEAFDVPNLNVNPVTFTDTGANGNGNGFADPGEIVALTVPLVNPFCGTSANNVSATVAGGGTGNYGAIAAGAVGSQVIAYAIPSDTACGTLLTIPVNIISSLGSVTRSFTLLVGQPTFSLTETLDSVVAPALPAGWTSTHTGVLANWVTSTTNPSSPPNDAFSNEVTTAASSEIVTPPIPIASANALLTFRNLFNLQSGLTTAFDGMVLEIAIPGVAGGAFQDILAAGGSFPEGGNGYNRTISAGTNPLNGRQCWSGLSAGSSAAPAYITTAVYLPAAANGQSVQLKWRRGDDSSGVAAGVTGARIDDVKVASSFTCSTVGPTPTPGITPTATPTSSPSPTATATPTPTPTPTPTITPPVTPTPPPTPTTTPTTTPISTATPPGTPTPSPTSSPTPPPPTVTPTPSTTPSPTPSITPSTTQVLNISTRLRVETGNSVSIGGFIITGTAPKQVLLRGIGPSLSPGISNALADPMLELHGPDGFVTITNNNWRDTQETAIVATGIPPTNDLESAILATLDPGAYTAILSGNNNGTGPGLVEIYDIGAVVDSQLANISTRGFVGTDTAVMIGGFILGGVDDSHVQIIGIGPSLAGSGISGALVDPTLELRDSNGTLVDSNDDCQGQPPSGTPLVNPPEACIDISLQPGAFTAILAGKDAGTGIGLVQIFNVP